MWPLLVFSRENDCSKGSETSVLLHVWWLRVCWAWTLSCKCLLPGPSVLLPKKMSTVVLQDTFCQIENPSYTDIILTDIISDMLRCIPLIHYGLIQCVKSYNPQCQQSIFFPKRAKRWVSGTTNVVQLVQVLHPVNRLLGKNTNTAPPNRLSKATKGENPRSFLGGKSSAKTWPNMAAYGSHGSPWTTPSGHHGNGHGSAWNMRRQWLQKCNKRTSQVAAWSRGNHAQFDS